MAAQTTALAKKGFTEIPTPAPADLLLENHLGDRPPSLALVRGSLRTTVALDDMPEIATFGAEIVGLSRTERTWPCIPAGGPAAPPTVMDCTSC